MAGHRSGLLGWCNPISNSRRMLRYLASRLCIAALMVLLATLVIFLIANMVPRDPVLPPLRDIAPPHPTMPPPWLPYGT